MNFFSQIIWFFSFVHLKNWILSAVEEYERSWEQNEELGLNDIDTSSADDAYNSTGTTSKEKTEE